MEGRGIKPKLKIDALIGPPSLNEVYKLSASAERLGFSGIWVQETRSDAFLMASAAALGTKRVSIGTAIALAFTRSPMTLAYTAWDLQRTSEGRFVLGLGTQVKRHIEGRFGLTWQSPVPKLREIILALRSIWTSWQTGQPLNFAGEFYKFNVMPPFFNPGPIKHAEIPIFISAVNPGMCRLAGELCQGLHLNPIHSARYVREVVIPNIEAGAAKSGRSAADVQICAPVLIVTGNRKREIELEKEKTRGIIGFYASTPAYRRVLELHGWHGLSERLAETARANDWESLQKYVSDEMLESFAVCAPLPDVVEAVLERYQGLVSRTYLYRPFEPNRQREVWRQLIESLNQTDDSDT